MSRPSLPEINTVTISGLLSAWETTDRKGAAIGYGMVTTEHENQRARGRFPVFAAGKRVAEMEALLGVRVVVQGRLRTHGYDDEEGLPPPMEVDVLAVVALAGVGLVGGAAWDTAKRT